MDYHAIVRAEAASRIVRTPKVRCVCGHFDMEETVAAPATVERDCTSAREPSTDPPRPQDLGRLARLRVPTLPHPNQPTVHHRDLDHLAPVSSIEKLAHRGKAAERLNV